jgi:hypothetical protein
MTESYSAVARPIDDVAADVAAAWSRIADATPRRARRRSILRVAMVILFTALTIPGGIVLWGVSSWMLRTHALLAAAPLFTHLAAIALALGLPSRFGMVSEHDASTTRKLLSRFASRADRLRALRTALVIESAVLGALPVLSAVVTRELPRWGVAAVIAVASTTIVWPLERIARAQRNEAKRLSALTD